MTREIALHCMKSASELDRELCEECPIYGQTGCDHCYEAALQYVIGMLEQEPILDKIRAEIDELYSYVEFDEDLKTSFNMVRLEEVQRVIDKYKAESEDKK